MFVELLSPIRVRGLSSRVIRGGDDAVGRRSVVVPTPNVGRLMGN